MSNKLLEGNVSIKNNTITTAKTIDNSVIYFAEDVLNQGKAILVNGEYYGGSQLIETTYKQLRYLKDISSLIPGAKYRITDYVTTTVQQNTKSAGHQFDIIVTAISENEFNENAKACLHNDDTYFKDANLDAWEIKYSIYNDVNRFIWADYYPKTVTTTSPNSSVEPLSVNETTTIAPDYSIQEEGKGVIYYMKDEFNNECWYDFKNIQFKCIVTQTHNNQEVELKPDGYDYAYTFTDYDANDLSLTSKARNNCIKRYNDSTSTIQYLNHTLFICSSVHNNVIEENSYCNVFYVNTCYYNTIGIAFQNNYINTYSEEGLKSIHNNIISNLFKSNRILSSFSRNIIGNTTTSCDFFSSFAFNKIGNNSWHIDFNYPVSYCEFGSYVQYCVFNNTAAYPPVVDEMKWCYIEDGLEGAQYFPCCQMITIQSRSLFSSSDNFHINDVELTDGRKLVEVLTQPHDEHLYIYKSGDKYDVATISDMKNISLISNPGTPNDNANNYGYTGTLQNIGVNGDIIFIDTITSYIRTGSASPNLGTPVWCRVLKHINGVWEVIYQSEYSKEINSVTVTDSFPNNGFSFKMKKVSDNIIKYNDRIAIVYSSTDDITNTLSSTQIGLRCTNTKAGGINNPLTNSSAGANNYQPIFTIKYISISDTPSTANAVTIEDVQTITGRKQFNGGINIAGKSFITNSIDGGELKVLHNGSSKGFIVRTRNSSANILPLEILSTNGSDSYQYNFPSKNGTVVLEDDFTTLENKLDNFIEETDNGNESLLLIINDLVARIEALENK